jgi:hypothetical protein
MFLEDFDRITNQLKESYIEREEYLDNIPSDINMIFCDNAYANSLGMDNDFLLRELFGEISDHVFWYMYEWNPGHQIEDKGITYMINSHENFVEATKQIYNLPMKPVEE